MKNNWQTKNLGDLIIENPKSSIKVRDALPAGRYVFFRSGDKTLFTNKFLCSGKNIFLATGGKAVVKYFGGKASYSTDVYSIKANSSVAISKYLYYFILLNLDFIENKLFKGATIKHLQKNDFKNLDIPLPSLSEQKWIVKILDEVFEKTAKAQENTERNLQNSNELFESYLQNVFTRRGKGWEEKRLGDIFEIERGGSPRPIQKYLTTDPNGINWIKIGDTKGISKYIYKTKQKIKPEGVKRSRLVKEGDFILSNSMSFGRPYIMKTTGCIHDGWLLLREKIESVDKNYLFLLLGSSLIFQQFNRLAAGSTVRNLNINLVKSVKIPVPKLSEQKTIVKKLDGLFTETQKLEHNYEQKLIDLEEFNKSILKMAFTNSL